MSHKHIFPHTLSLKIPSKNCNQHLSVNELEDRTQNNRVIRFAKMQKHKEEKNDKMF